MAQASPITLENAVAWLARQRQTQEKVPSETVRYGEWMLEHHQLHALGDHVWAFLEQVGTAAAEVGNQGLAELCVSRIAERFPDSARVVLLQGALLESRGKAAEAQALYESFLKTEPSHILVNKRCVAAIRAQPDGVALATAALAELVDVFSGDEEAWLELAALYVEQHKYAQAAYALEEVLLLSPHNVFYLLKYAEVLYTMGEAAKAYKVYLRILELGNGNLADTKHPEDRTQGPWLRALWGLKMCTAQLTAPKTKTASSDGDASAQDVSKVDAMVTKLLMEGTYAADAHAPAPASMRAAARTVLANTP
ncbi:TPR-like protein [Malassezia sp. CBS 17886]|nr:TPR-like protein [Malassezia sp. CBS 17886]